MRLYVEGGIGEAWKTCQEAPGCSQKALWFGGHTERGCWKSLGVAGQCLVEISRGVSDDWEGLVFSRVFSNLSVWTPASGKAN